MGINAFGTHRDLLDFCLGFPSACYCLAHGATERQEQAFESRVVKVPQGILQALQFNFVVPILGVEALNAGEQRLSVFVGQENGLQDEAVYGIIPVGVGEGLGSLDQISLDILVIVLGREREEGLLQSPVKMLHESERYAPFYP